jgi:hypothetical protein
VQVVGPDRVEVAANKVTGEVRAYVLDSAGHPVDPRDRKITLAIQAEQPELITLEPEPRALFLVSNLRTRVDPKHVTIAVTAHGATHACLAGWSPGSVVLVGAAAPRVHLLVVEAWPAVVVGAPEVGVRGGATVHAGAHGHAYGHEH